jgi:23S rRNA (adenine-N6)-dimethyltransferase
VSGELAWWGFHQLRDSHARRLVVAARIRPGDLVVDLGAGTGAITRHLLSAGASVMAVERHPTRAAILAERYAAQDCRVVSADIADFRLPNKPFRVVANPPFGLLATTLRRITARRSRLVRADLVVPSYLAARVTRGAHDCCRHYHATTTRRLPRDAFTPPATQPTSVLTLCRLSREGSRNHGV